jgi:hypothetical protein
LEARDLGANHDYTSPNGDSAENHRFDTAVLAINKATEFDAVAGEIYFLRTESRLGAQIGTVSLRRVPANEALEELNSCCRSGP